jgi:hypothetical protein
MSRSVTSQAARQQQSRFMCIARGDPSKAAPLATQRVFMGVMWLIWDAIFFLAQGHTVAGVALLALPLSWFGLAWRARGEKPNSRSGAPQDARRPADPTDPSAS